MIDYQSLETTPFTALHGAWVRAFSDYQVAVDMPLWKLERMLTRRGYVPELSMGAFVSGEPIAFTLNGVRDWNGVLTAYDAGTAVIPEYRKQGITSRLFESLLVMLRAKQTAQYLLEVLQSNTPAFQLYRKKGFEITRSFACFRGGRDPIQLRTAWPVENPDGFSAAEWERLAMLGDYQPSWQNSAASVRAVPTDFYYAVARRTGEIVGYGVIDSKTGDVPQLAVRGDHRRRGVAASILANLIQRTESPRISLVNVDSESKTMIAFLNALGFERFVDQYEMLLEL